MDYFFYGVTTGGTLAIGFWAMFWLGFDHGRHKTIQAMRDLIADGESNERGA